MGGMMTNDATETAEAGGKASGFPRRQRPWQ